MNKKIAYVWLSKLKITYKEKMRLINEFGSVSKLFYSSLDDLVYFNVKEKYLYHILNKELKENACKDFEYMKQQKIDIIGIEDKYYPRKFMHVFEKPICFYIKGNKNILDEVSIRYSWI